MEDRERLQLLNYVQLQVMEYLCLTNQNLQLDPILVHLRLIARMQKWGTPNYGLCINIINEVKKKAKNRELTASSLYLLIHPIIYPDESELVVHVKEFFNMLIENSLVDYTIGPPFTAETCIPDERPYWANFADIITDTNHHMTVAMEANLQRVKMKWTISK